MLGLKFVPLDLLSLSLGIRGVETQAVFTGNQREGLSEIAAQLVWCSSFAGIIAGDSKAPAEESLRLFEAANVVALPAVKGDGNAGELRNGLIDINANFGVSFFGEGERAFKVLY
jgi:hypothetical protein